jgi:hypothetical protein
MALQSEGMAAALPRGESVDTEQSVRVANVLSRLVSRLGRRAKALTPGRHDSHATCRYRPVRCS